VNDTRDRRSAENENLFRRINERVEQLGRGLGALPLVCECSDAGCVERLPAVAVVDYEEVRAHGDRFFVAPGHESGDVEIVVDERPGYLVVAKRGEAGEVARAGDPRSA
jgi:hypothetical protein